MPDLVQALLGGDDSDPPRLVYGTVATVSPLTVTVPPSTLAVPAYALTDSMFTVGQKVSILQQGADRLVLGPMTSDTSPSLPITAVRRGGGGGPDTLGTGGGAIASCVYNVADGKCFFAIKYQFGTSGAAAGAGVTTFDCPVSFGAANTTFQHVGSGVGIQAGARFNFEVTRDAGSNGFQLYGPAQVSSTVPGAVTFGDSWNFNGWYWV